MDLQAVRLQGTEKGGDMSRNLRVSSFMRRGPELGCRPLPPRVPPVEVPSELWREELKPSGDRSGVAGVVSCNFRHLAQGMLPGWKQQVCGFRSCC